MKLTRLQKDGQPQKWGFELDDVEAAALLYLILRAFYKDDAHVNMWKATYDIVKMTGGQEGIKEMLDESSKNVPDIYKTVFHTMVLEVMPNLKPRRQAMLDHGISGDEIERAEREGLHLGD
jgi:hypothetical protein